MYSNTQSASLRLLSAGVLDQEQLRDSERLRRLGETQRRTASALLTPASSSARSHSAPDPVTKGFLGTSLFSKLLSRQSSLPKPDTVTSRRPSEVSLVSRFGILDDQQLTEGAGSRRASWLGPGNPRNLVSMLDREQLSSSRPRCNHYR